MHRRLASLAALGIIMMKLKGLSKKYCHAELVSASTLHLEL